MDQGRPVLVPDVLIQILEEAYQTTALRGLRVVCKLFDDILVPIVYRQICLTERIVSCFESRVHDSAQLQVRDHIRKNSQYILVDRELDWPIVKLLFYSLERLQGLRWSPWGYRHSTPTSSLNAILDWARFQAKWPDLRLFIGAQESLEDVPDEYEYYFCPNGRPCLLFDYDYTNLTSCKVDLDCDCDVHVKIVRLIATLRATHRLEHLYLIGDPRHPIRLGSDIVNGKRLPPVTKLVLRAIEWEMSLSSGVTFWDWSRVSHLELYDVPIIEFLRAVTPEHLPNLRAFMTDSRCSEMFARDPSHQDELLCNFIKGIQALEKLAIRCLITTPDYTEAVAKHRSTLRALEIRCLGRRTRFGTIPIFIEKLVALNSACPDLREIGLDIKLRGKAKPRKILTTTIAAFRKLRSLTVYAYIVTDDQEQAYTEVCNTAFAWVDDLAARKQGVQLEKVVFRIDLWSYSNDKDFVTLTYTHDFGGVAEWHCSKRCASRISGSSELLV